MCVCCADARSITRVIKPLCIWLSLGGILAAGMPEMVIADIDYGYWFMLIFKHHGNHHVQGHALVGNSL